MKRAFVAASYENKEETQRLCSVLEKTGLEIYCFARDEGVFTNPSEMMNKVKEEIEKSDIFIMDVTEKHMGRSIEAGIAYAMGKKVIFLSKKDTVIKDTVKGISDNVIEYSDITEVTKTLPKFI